MTSDTEDYSGDWEHLEGMPIAYQAGKTIVFRASGFGNCVRALVASLFGEPEQYHPRAEQILMTAAGEGNLHEDQVIQRIKDKGYTIDYALAQRQGYEVSATGKQVRIELQLLPNVIVRGHLDMPIYAGPGITTQNQLVPGEVKTMSRDRYRAWQKNGFDEVPKYAWQISAYMYGVGATQALYVVKNRDSGVLDVQMLEAPPVPLRDLRKKAVEVLMWYTRGELPPCDRPASNEFFCPYWGIHDIDLDEGDDAPVTDSITEAVVHGMAQKHYELSQRIRPLRPLEEERRELSKEMMKYVMQKQMQVGEYHITRVDQQRSYTDEAAIIADLGITLDEFKEKYKKTSPSTYFKVKLEKGGDDA